MPILPIQPHADPHTRYIHIMWSLACNNLLIKKQVHLLVTKRDNPGFLQLYTTTITAAFLCKLDQPSIFSDSSLVIQYACPPLPVSQIIYEIAVIVKPPR